MRGQIFFFSGPSGVGKGTLINALRNKHKTWVFPTSCTTRKPRPGEKDGETYYFISKAEFKRRIKNDEFLEYAEVHGGNLYGTLKKEILDPLEAGKVIIREFDVQGFFSAREILDKEDYVSIFVRPVGGIHELVHRIQQRAPISKDELEKRIESMGEEFKYVDLYDFHIYSEDGLIDKLIYDAEDIIKGVMQKMRS